MQRGHALLGDDVRLGPVAEERGGDLHLVLLGGDVQGRVAVLQHRPARPRAQQRPGGLRGSRRGPRPAPTTPRPLQPRPQVLRKPRPWPRGIAPPSGSVLENAGGAGLAAPRRPGALHPHTAPPPQPSPRPAPSASPRDPNSRGLSPELTGLDSCLLVKVAPGPCPRHECCPRRRGPAESGAGPRCALAPASR